MKTTHITKAIALVMTMMMLLSCVPSSVLPVFASADSQQSSIFDNVTLGKGTVTNTEAYNGPDYAAGPKEVQYDSANNPIVWNQYSPYEPYATNDETHPFLPGGSAWIDLKSIFYGAPATPNIPLTKWSANTSVVNITGTGDKYDNTHGVLSGKEINAIDDMNLIDEYLWATDSAPIGSDVNNIEYGIVQSGVKKHDVKLTIYKKAAEASENGKSIFYNMETGKKMENIIFKDTNGDGSVSASGDIFDIDGNHIPCSWDGEEKLSDGTTVYKYSYSTTFYDVERKPLEEGEEDVSARVYNRYDAMQGKWGLTLDKNVSSVMWSPTWAANYYGAGKALNNSDLYLSDTPYLFFSTEAPDSTQMAISLLIGAPVQSERKATNNGQTKVTKDSSSNYEFRWYTITDNSDRPGVDTESMDYSMVPNVTVSDVVYDHYALTSSSSDLLALMLANDPDSLNPLKVAEKAGKDPETMYVNGAITGCIDFTQLLPLLMSMYDKNDQHHGREDVKYKIAQIRVDTKTSEAVTFAAEGVEDSACRINYMYFGPGQATIYTPQSVVGNDINGANWMYAQLDDQIGDQNPNRVAKNRQNVDSDTHKAGDVISGYYIGDNNFDFDSSYTNGWDNGMAVSVTNTPNNPQLMTIDTYGKGDGQYITYDQYYNDMLAHYKAIDGTDQDPDGKKDEKIDGHGIYQLAEFTKCSVDSKSRIWKYTDLNGNVQYLETEHNHYDDVQYIMVTVPIRKWVNVLGDSRKLSFNINVEQYSTQGGGKIDPTFCIWGNNMGSVGPGHGDIKTGNRFRGEDMLAVFGKGYYQVDCSYNYAAAEIDKTLGNATFYDGTDSWFDWLRSPYVYGLTITDATVKANGTRLGYGDEMIGYTFVTAIRYAVPAGTKFTVQGMKGDGNSAGLNTYSTSGAIVSAHDGGTGVQPEIHVDQSLNEKIVTSTGSSSEGYTYYENPNGTLKGTQSTGAAAYGPMLEQSFYTIYDMLDTERLNTAGNSSHDKNKTGQDMQHVYGQMWITTKADLPVYRGPYTWATVDGYTYESSCQVPVYATISFPGYNNQKWGVTGSVDKNGTSHVGYVLLSDSSGTYATADAGELYKTYSFNSYTDYVAKYDPSTNDQSVAISNFAKEFLQDLRNEWTLSNFIGKYGSIKSADNSSGSWKAVENTTHSGKEYKEGKDVYSGDSYGVQLMYANMWRRQGGTSTTNTLKDITFRAVNTTDMQLSYTRKKNTANNFSFGMSRIFDEPITLHTNTIHQSFPVFYFDFTAPPIQDGKSSMSIGISMRINGVDKMYYLDADDGCLKAGYHADLGGNMYGYFSFEDIITATKNGTNTIGGTAYDNYGTVEVVGISIYFWRDVNAYTGGDSETMTFRRLEIWQEETDWLDTIIADNQHMSGLGEKQSTKMNEKVKDSMNIINDAFFHSHDERNDGNISISRVNGSDGKGVLNDMTGVNSTLDGYKYKTTDNTESETVMLDQSQFANMSKEQFELTRSKSYRKTNSNKGWAARIQADTNGDNVIDERDDRYFSYDFNSSTETIKTNKAGKNLYEYRSSLGHLRVWVPAGQTASVVFEADRSFNTKNYKYLYYSYSMRDVATGISAEDKSVDGKGSGVAVAIKSQQNTSDRAYMEADGSWVYYAEGTPYWSDQNREDRRQFNTTMNAALDLSTTNLESINQLVFYLRNSEATDTAEFYINYIYLSNVPPTDMITRELEQVQTQYYYLMDNTGDRYSARFPTLDNPTGQVTGLKNDELGTDANANDRVNPIKVVRGEYLSTGTYFNNQSIRGYGDYETGDIYDKTGNGIDGSMKDIMFYSGVSADEGYIHDIGDYYTYKDTNGDGEKEIYDMMWSYGRWYTDENEGGLNNMFIGSPNASEEEKADGNFRENNISGALTRRYATENYVLLRAGIEPKKFTTYYDADGGEFLYDNMEADSVENLQKLTENSYFITDNVILSYFTQPKNIDIMKGDKGSDEKVFLQKPGYKFAGWYHIDNETGDLDYEFNEEVGTLTEDAAKLMLYIRKQEAKIDYFKAKWVELTPDDEGYEDFYVNGTWNEETKTSTPKTFDVQFMYDETTPWTTVTVGATEDQWNTRYATKLPTASRYINGVRTNIYGWTADGGKTVYAPGSKVYVLKEGTVFTAVTDAAAAGNLVHKITLNNAQLYVMTSGTNAVHEQLVTDGRYGIGVLQDGDKYIYTNVPHDIRLVAKPIEGGEIAKGTADGQTVHGGWIEIAPNYNTDKNGLKYVVDLPVILSDNTEKYYFTSNRDLEIQYQDIGTIMSGEFYQSQLGAYMSIVPNLVDDALVNEKVHFTSQFSLPAGAVKQAAGTLYTKSTYYDTFKNADESMRLNINSVDASSVSLKNYETANTTAVRYVQATKTSESNEFTMSVGRSNKSDALYYARSYVIYTIDGEYYVAYSSVVAFDLAEILE